MFRKFTVLCFLLPISIFSQSYNELNLSSSSRSLALGGDIISIMDNDVSLACITPSLLSPSMHNQISFNFVDYVSSVNLLSVHYARNLSGSLNSSGSFMIFSGIDVINYGEFSSADDIGNTLPKFTANQQLFTLGISKYLGSNITLGSNLKLLNSNLETYHAMSLSSNIAATYHVQEKDFTCTFLVKNIGTTINSYTDINEELPFEVQFGLSKSLKYLPFRYSIILHHLNVYDISNDIDKEPVAKKLLRHVILGGELNLFRKNIYLRAGFNFNRREDLKLSSAFTMSGFSWGLGFSIKKIQINYSRSAFHRSSMINSFSIVANLSTFGL